MRVDFVTDKNENWVEVFVDGKQRYAGHSIHPDWIRELILLPAHSVNDWVFDFQGPLFLLPEIDFENAETLEEFGLEKSDGEGN